MLHSKRWLILSAFGFLLLYCLLVVRPARKEKEISLREPYLGVGGGVEGERKNSRKRQDPFQKQSIHHTWKS